MNLILVTWGLTSVKPSIEGSCKPWVLRNAEFSGFIENWVSVLLDVPLFRGSPCCTGWYPKGNAGVEESIERKTCGEDPRDWYICSAQWMQDCHLKNSDDIPENWEQNHGD